MAAPLAGRLLRLLQVVGVNAIPLGGVLVGDWQLSTAISIYWFETLIGTAFVILRMAAHRHLTRKQGYWYAPVQDEPAARSSATRRARARYVPVRQNFIERFAIIVTVFTLAHGLILALFLLAALKQPPEWQALGYASLGVLGFQGLSLAADLAGLRERPFAWIRTIAGQYLGRVVVVHLSIIFGAFAAAYLEQPASFFAAFGVLKLVTDIGSWLPHRQATLPDTPPRWMVSLLARTEPGADPHVEWAALRRIQDEQRVFWEEAMPPG